MRALDTGCSRLTRALRVLGQARRTLQLTIT
jgi:hypothetical protein